MSSVEPARFLDTEAAGDEDHDDRLDLTTVGEYETWIRSSVSDGRATPEHVTAWCGPRTPRVGGDDVLRAVGGYPPGRGCRTADRSARVGLHH